jgi:hypothetical protein
MRTNLAYVSRLEDLILQFFELENARAKGGLARDMPLLHREAEAIRASRQARDGLRSRRNNQSS